MKDRAALVAALKEAVLETILTNPKPDNSIAFCAEKLAAKAPPPSGPNLVERGSNDRADESNMAVSASPVARGGASEPDQQSPPFGVSSLPAPTEIHPKARSQDNPAYPRRQHVPDSQVHWSSGYPGYAPDAWTHDAVFANSRELSTGGKWADPDPPAKAELERRTTFAGDGRARPLSVLTFDGDVPLNPVGRTGMRGRGLLGKWGPNHAADPIVTRLDPEQGRMQVLVIQRKDTNQVCLSSVLSA